jgi:ABC-type amino acid transport substrate-binding protein
MSFIRYMSGLRLLSALVVSLSCVTVAPEVLADTDTRLQRIEQQGVLKVCIWPEYFSISYLNQKSGELQGIDIDLSSELAKDLGVNLEYVNTHFGRFMDDLEAGACDVAMFGVGRTAPRMQRVDFSQPYLASGMYGITTKTHTHIDSWEAMDQPGNVICVQRGTYMEGEMRKFLKQAELSVVQKPYEREIEVRSGRADVFITDFPYGQKMLSQYDWARLLTPASQGQEKFEYAYAIAKGQPQWLARVERFVSDVKADGRLRRYAEKHGLTPIVLE